MNKLIDYFTPKEIGNYLNQQITKSFIVISFIEIIIYMLIFILVNIKGNENGRLILFIIPVMIIFIALTLFILKKYGIKYAGSIHSIALVLIICISLNILSEEISVVNKLTGGFYVVFAFLALTALFSSRKILLLNAFLVLLSTTRVLSFGLEHFPEELPTLRMAYIMHTAVLIIFTATMYVIMLFLEKSIFRSEEDQVIKHKQNKKLKDAFTLIEDSSSVLKKLSENLNITSESLNTNANEQASSIEEISTTLEEITSSIHNNAANSQNTAQSIASTTDFSKRNDEAITKTLSAVHEVDSKISLIQDIANRTEILSINASIEAARAGDAGLGFSVVAQEVKKLAEKSSAGSSEIIDLIQKTIKVSGIAAENYLYISSEIKKINTSVSEISHTNVEQQISVDQINEAINVVNDGAQSNVSNTSKLVHSLSEMQLYIDKIDDILINKQYDD